MGNDAFVNVGLQQRPIQLVIAAIVHVKVLHARATVVVQPLPHLLLLLWRHLGRIGHHIERVDARHQAPLPRIGLPTQVQGHVGIGLRGVRAGHNGDSDGGVPKVDRRQAEDNIEAAPWVVPVLAMKRHTVRHVAAALEPSL